VLLILTVAAITLLISALISIWLSKFHNLHIPSVGTIHTLGVKAYWDSDLNNETKEIQWGTVYPGSLNNVTVYLQSICNVNATLELTPVNWTFNNSKNAIVLGPTNNTSYMSLIWNYDNSTVTPAQILQVTLTLQVENSLDFTWFLINNNVKTFSFDIIIRANEK
jgi:hypothetical protein